MGHFRSSTSIDSVSRLRRRAPDLALPPYQRDLVWTPDQAVECVDSVGKGYAIGVIILWSTWSRAAVKTYVIDGQQRLTALTGRRPGGSQEQWRIFWDLDMEKWTASKPQRGLWLWDSIRHPGFFDRMDRIGGLGDPAVEAALRRADDIQHAAIAVHWMDGHSAGDVREMFRRLNSSGTSIGDDELKALLGEIDG